MNSISWPIKTKLYLSASLTPCIVQRKNILYYYYNNSNSCSRVIPSESDLHSIKILLTFDNLQKISAIMMFAPAPYSANGVSVSMCSVINLIILYHSYTTSELSPLSYCLTFDLIRITSISRKPTVPISLQEKALYLWLILPWLVAVINKANFRLSSSPGNKQIRLKKSADQSLNPCNRANECP